MPYLFLCGNNSRNNRNNRSSRDNRNKRYHAMPKTKSAIRGRLSDRLVVKGETYRLRDILPPKIKILIRHKVTFANIGALIENLPLAVAVLTDVLREVEPAIEKGDVMEVDSASVLRFMMVLAETLDPSGMGGEDGEDQPADPT